MEARSFMSWYCGSLLAAVIALFLSVSLGVRAATGGIDLKAPCAATPYPAVCQRALSADRIIKAGGAAATTPLDLASAALRAASASGGAVGEYARKQLDVVKDNLTWQCLNECAEDIEEALDHLDDSEGGGLDAAARLRDVRRFLDTAERDTWSCDESCGPAPPSPVKDDLLARNKDFEALMRVANALVKTATGGGGAPAPAPA